MRRAIPVILFLCAGSLATPDRRACSGPDPRYYRYDQILGLFDTWDAQYPAIFHREIIGYTGEGQEPIWAARISDNPWQHDPEASLLFSAALHANEPNGTNAIVYMMERLLSRYGDDSTVTGMVNNLQIWFVPIVNVDGHRMFFGDVPYWEEWRKNKRDNDESGTYTFPADGVDLNRNWDHRWAEYDSTEASSLYYKGPFPFSEPEIQAVRDLVLREMPVFVVDYHSPVHGTQGRLVWWPWRFSGSNDYGPDEPFYKPISQALGARTQSEVDTVYYNGNGASSDLLPKEQNWVYGNTGICALLMEVSLRNLWDGAVVDTIAARVGRGSFYLMERAIVGPGLTGRVTDAETGWPLIAEVRIEEVDDPRIGPRLTEGVYGQYWRLLSSGDYTGSISAEGYQVHRHAIHVGAYGWTRVDFRLTRLDPASARSLSDRSGGGPKLWIDSPLVAGQPIRYELGEEALMSLDLLDVSGRRISILDEGPKPAGIHHAVLRGVLPSGVYWVRLQAGDQETVAKVLSVR